MKTIDEIREDLARKYINKEFVGDTIELVGESFIADDRTILGKVNDEYVKNELDWYLSESLNVNDIPGGAPRIWRMHASDYDEINSNYGYLIFNPANGSQYVHVLNKLLANENTRQATMIYTRPNMHSDWCRDGMSDFICTNTVQYLIRDGKLETIVQMRSNDVVFGYRNDYAWQTYVRDSLLEDLNSFDRELQAGDIVWNAASLHVYARHYHVLEKFIETGDPYVEVTK